MHLLTLLIATAFSSQFVEPNALTEMTLDPAEVTIVQLQGTLPPIEIDLNEAPTTIVGWKLALDPAGATTAVDIPSDQIVNETNATAYTFTHVSTTALGPLYADGIPTKIYLVLTYNTNVKISAKIAIKPVFTVGPATLREYQLTDENLFTLSGDTATWPITAAVWWAVCPESQRTAALLGEAKVKGTATPNPAGTVKVTLTAAQIASLGELTNNVFYFYAGVTNAAGAAANPPAEVTVAIPKFTANKAVIPINIAGGKAFAIDLTAKDGTDWALNTLMTVVIAKNPDGTTNAKTYDNDLKAKADNKVTLSIADGDWAEIDSPGIGDKLHIWAGIKDGWVLGEVTPIRLDIVADYSTSTTTVYDCETKLSALKVTATTDAWVTTKKIKVTIMNDTKGQPNATEIKVVDALTATGSDYTVGDVDLDKENIKKGKIVVYVDVANDAGTAYDDKRGPVEIAYLPAQFKLGEETLKDSAKSLTTTILVTDDIAPAAKTNELKFWITKAPVANPEEDLIIEEAIVAAKAASPNQTYNINAAPIPEIEDIRLTEDDTLYIYAGYEKKIEDGGGYVIYKHARTIDVIEDTDQTRFSVEPTTISVDDLAALKKITITQKFGAEWPSIKVKLNKQGAATPAPETATAIELTDDVCELTLTDDMKTLVAGLKKDEKLEVSVFPTGKVAYYTQTALVTVTAGRLITVIDPATVTKAAWEAFPTFEMTLQDSVVFTKGTSKIAISRNPTLAALTGTNDIIKEGLEATNKKLTVALVQADITKFTTIATTPLTVYVFVSTSGSTIDDQTPATFTITANPPKLEFAVDPTEIKDDAEEIKGLKITPTTPAGWGATIQFKLSTDAPAAFSWSNTVVTGTAVNASNVWTANADVDLSGFELTAGETLYVYASMSNDASYLPVPAEIEIKAAVTPTFTINPTTMDWAATLNTPVITVVPGAGADFPAAAGGTFKAIFSYGTATPIDKAIAVSTGETKVYTIPVTDLSAFDIKETDLPKDITVKINNGKSELDHTVKLNVKKAGGGDAAMGVSPILSLLVALVFLFVKLF